MFRQKDGLLWTDIFAEATINTPQHIDLERERIFLDVTLLELAPNDGNRLRRADLLTEKTGHTFLPTVLVGDQGRRSSIVRGKLPTLFRVFHRHLGSEQVTERELESAENFG